MTCVKLGYQQSNFVRSNYFAAADISEANWNLFPDVAFECPLARSGIGPVLARCSHISCTIPVMYVGFVLAHRSS